MPTLLTQNQSFVLLPEITAVAFWVTQGRAAVYEMSDVISLPFFYCLNRNLLKSCSRAVVSNLIRQRFHPSDLNKAVSRSYCEAVDLLWPFVFA